MKGAEQLVFLLCGALVSGRKATTAKTATTTTTTSAPVMTVTPRTQQLGNNYFNVEYMAPVTFGNGQVQELILDTGSSDVWVRGPSCTSNDGSCGVKGQPALHLADSSLKSLGSTFDIPYGSGSLIGNIYTGPVSVAGMTANIPFGVATTESGFNDNDEAGILGLGFNSISTISSTLSTSRKTVSANWFDALGLAGAKQLFSFYFTNNTAPGSDFGEVTFGGVDTSRYTGALQYIPLNADSWWQFSLTGSTFSVGGGKAVKFNNPNGGIVDTGTCIIMVDIPSADAINKAIGAGPFNSSLDIFVFNIGGMYPIDCSISKTGPPVAMTLGGVSFNITAQDYVFPLGNGKCASSFGRTFAGSQSIFGLTLLRKYYSVFDKYNSRVGFALANHA